VVTCCKRNTIESRADFDEVGLSRVGQFHPSVQAAEHGCAKPIFEYLDVAAYGTVSHVELFRRALEAAEAGRGFEGPEGIERRQTSLHSGQFSSQEA
jgi:hypothetical protein